MGMYRISICLVVLLHLILLKGCVCQMQVNGKLQIRLHLVCWVRIGTGLGGVAVGSVFKLIMLKLSCAAQRPLGIKHWAGQTWSR